MIFSLDLPSATALFVGLLATYIYLFQFTHSRHHELSLECFRMREKIMALREKIAKLLEENTTSRQVQPFLNELIAEETAWCKAYEIVKNRYYSATTGIKCVPVGVALTVLVGLSLIVLANQKLPLWMWICAIIVAVLPVLAGTGFIFFGDLWKAEKAQDIMHEWFACQKSPAESLQATTKDEGKIIAESSQPTIKSKNATLISTEAMPESSQQR